MSDIAEGALGFTCIFAVENGRVPADFYDPWWSAGEFDEQRPALADGWYFWDLENREHHGPYPSQVIAKRVALRHEAPKYLPKRHYGEKCPIVEFEVCANNLRDYLLHLQHNNRIKPSLAAEMTKLLWDTKEDIIEKVYLPLEPEGMTTLRRLLDGLQKED